MAVLEHAELLEFLDLFEVARRQRRELVQQRGVVGVETEVLVAGVGGEPVVVDRKPEVARERQPRAPT